MTDGEVRTDTDKAQTHTEMLHAELSGLVIGKFYRVYDRVEGKMILEVKASQAIGEADRKQVMNYLRGTNVELGLLLHFGPKAAFQRILYTNDRKRL